MSQYLGDISAYALAVSQGYTGTEEEYAELMASYATVGQTAVTAAQTATTKASEAATSATTATTKASEATTAATTATNKAAEAQADADAAALDASQALSAASTATSKATEATTAAATATSAATTATTAKDDAVSAKTAAQTAQTGAETAAASVQSSAAQIAQNTSDISELKEDFATMESDGVVPSAEQILSDKGVTDSVPYHYRKTGGNGSDREYVDAIVGGTVNWNQFSNTKSISLTAGEVSTPEICRINGVNTHKYLFAWEQVGNLSSSIRNTMQIADGASIIRQSVLENYHNNSGLYYWMPNATTLADELWQLSYWAHTLSNDIAIDDIQIFDLTAMFGAEIADYIYSLEQANTGAGVAFFKALFPNDYYPYNSGELVSVSGLNEHKMVGFNQWDEEWEVGGISNTTGENTVTTTTYRTKNYIRLINGEDYYFYIGGSDTMGVRLYDSEKNFIRSLALPQSTLLKRGSQGFPANVAYMRFVNTSTATYNHDICINLSDPSKNGTYEPYSLHSYPLDSSLTLRGIPKLTDGKMYFDGDKYNADGTVERRYGIVDLGTLNWGKISTTSELYRFVSGTTNAKNTVNNNSRPNALCPKYETITPNDTYVNVVGISVNTELGQIMVCDTSYSTSGEFKTAMSGVYLVYELATPTTESADPYQHLQQCDPNGTEEYVSTGIVPVGHETRYPENLKSKIEGLPWNFASLIAPTESAFVATRNYVTGDLFIVQNVLYKATSNIANGGTITPNTNCTATTLAEIISALA